jgi:hypothetical protein
LVKQGKDTLPCTVQGLCNIFDDMQPDYSNRAAVLFLLDPRLDHVMAVAASLNWRDPCDDATL